MAKQMMSKEKNVEADVRSLALLFRKATDIRPRALAGVLASAVALDGAGFTPAKASSRS